MVIITFFRKYFFLFVLALFFISCAETSDSDYESDEISILDWNLETFFDGQFDGNEYTEFKNEKAGWSMEKYSVRLERLAEVIKKMDADVVVMEELEKEDQLHDIFNQLAGNFNFSKLYKYGTFAASKDGSIGCGIISRFPLKEITVHEISFDSSKEKQPSMRPIIQMNIDTGKKSLTLFVNHWKSKSGGAEETDFWRNLQEKNLSRLISNALDKNSFVIATGDFNRDIEEFEYVENEKFNIRLKGSENILVSSPWYDSDGKLNEYGSYWYKDHWERIDHFFACGETQILEFAPQTQGDWANEEGHPFKYMVYNGKGYSDHLPILCKINF